MELKNILNILMGINGSGKSTFREINQERIKGITVDPDKIAREINPKDPEAVSSKAARKALIQIKEFLNKGISFNQETTLASKQPLRTMDLAKQSGYVINLIYIGLESKDQAKNRVKIRVEMGLHNIPDADIDRRYPRTLQNLPKAINLADNVMVFDNSKKAHELICIISNNKIKYIGNELPGWFRKALPQYNMYELLKNSPGENFYYEISKKQLDMLKQRKDIRYFASSELNKNNKFNIILKSDDLNKLKTIIKSKNKNIEKGI